ncbi:MAG: winged helix-turn-helix domain-containing protein [Thermosphaera sp.]
MSNRTKIDIVERILDYLAREEKALKTHILYASNLNSNSLSRYLDWMVKLGLISYFEDGRNIIYTITEKGIEVLEGIRNINDLINAKRDILSEELTLYRDVFKRTFGGDDFTVSYGSIIGKSGLTHSHLIVKYGGIEYLLLSINEARVSRHMLRSVGYSLLVSDDTGLPLLIVLRNRGLIDLVSRIASLVNPNRVVKTIVV